VVHSTRSVMGQFKPKQKTALLAWAGCKCGVCISMFQLFQQIDDRWLMAKCMSTQAITTLFVIVTLFCGCATGHREPTELDRQLAADFQKKPGDCIPRSWLIEEISDAAITSDKRATAEVIRMMQSKQPGDRVFFYRSPSETWAALLGQGGFAIVRDGRPIQCVMTVEN
jgi:hypothetical protein